MPIDRPTILQIIPNLDTGGAEQTTVEVADAIVRGGGRAIVLAGRGRLWDATAATGAELVEFPAATKNPVAIAWNGFRLAGMVARENVDIVHARSRAPAWSALIAARRTGVGFVTTYHGAFAENSALKRAYNGVMARSDIVIANSRFTADLIRRRYDTPEARIRVIDRGIDAVRFDATRIAPERMALLRTAWRVPPAARVILQVARLTGWKGQSVLIEAFGRLVGQGCPDDIHLVLAGDAQGRGGYVAELEQRIAAHGLDARVHIVGHVEDVPAAYLAALLTVVPSIEPEAFGRAATEAQAMGCPVIATDIGAPAETVRAAPRVPIAERTGWLVAPGDPDALAGALAEAIGLDDAGRRDIGARARRHVLSTYTLEGLQRQTLAVYDHLLGSRLADRFGESVAARRFT